MLSAVSPFAVSVLMLQFFAPDDSRKLVDTIPTEIKGGLLQVGDAGYPCGHLKIDQRSTSARNGLGKKTGISRPAPVDSEARVSPNPKLPGQLSPGLHYSCGAAVLLCPNLA